MNRLLDKGALFLLCAVWYLQNVRGSYAVVPALAAVIVCAGMSLLVRDWQREAMFGIYLIFCLSMPTAAYFLPVVCYDMFFLGKPWLFLLGFLPLCAAWQKFGLRLFLTVVLMGTVAYFLRRRTDAFTRLSERALSMRDDARETELRLIEKNRDLLEKQEYEVRLATLTERNRIARDIHDTVGHLLSSAILQIGALLAVTKEESMHKNLQTLKATLSSGMDSVRADLHDLHDQSLDLRLEARQLVNAFRFCPAGFEYDVENAPSSRVQVVLIAVLKEALSNIMKHSDATAVHVLLREHPGFYQLIVQDNGHTPAEIQRKGLGLQNITERVESLDGRVRFRGGDGFLVFVTVPKGDRV